jgi:hypothetical protein
LRSNFVSNFYTSGNFIRISLRSSAALKAASEETRLAYIQQQIWNRQANNQLLGFYEDCDINKDRTAEFEYSFDLNPELAKTTANVIVRVKPKASVVGFEGCMALFATRFEETTLGGGSGTPTTVGLTEVVKDRNSVEMFWKSQRVVKFNWKKLSRIVFGVLKCVFDLVMIAMAIGRSFLKPFKRLNAAWIAQTTMYFQLLMYTGLVQGLFGGVVDQIHEGALEASREIFFVNQQPNWDSGYLSRTKGFVVYKFYLNDITPSLTQELIYQTFAVFVVIILNWGAQLFSKSEKVKRFFSEMESMASAMGFIPILTISLYVLWTATIVDHYSWFWQLFNVVQMIFWLTYYTWRITTMGLSVASINYLHSRGVYQSGKVDKEQGVDWAFDTYISMHTDIINRILEFFIYGLIAANYVLGYELKAASCLFGLALWAALTYLSVHKHGEYKDMHSRERDASRTILKLSIAFNALMVLQYVVYVVFWLFREMKLGWVKFLTWVYLLDVLLCVAVLLGQLGLRIMSFEISPEWLEEQAGSEKQSYKAVTMDSTVS